MDDAIASLLPGESPTGGASEAAGLRLAEVHRKLGLSQSQARFLWRMVLLSSCLTERGCGPGLREMAMGVLELVRDGADESGIVKQRARGLLAGMYRYAGEAAAGLDGGREPR